MDTTTPTDRPPHAPTEDSTPVALVTGASSATGIGRATARALRDAGFRVVAGARSTQDLDALASEGLDPVQLDVTDEASMTAAVRAAEALTGRVDVLVNNAGYGEMGAIEEVSVARWRRQFDTNVFGLVRMTQLVLPGMRRAGRGHVVHVGSMGGTFTYPLAGAYHASKYAVESISDALRFEVAPFGVQVTLVQPAGVDTNLAAGTLDMLRTDPGSPYEEMTSRYLAAMQAGVASQMLTPELVATRIVEAVRTSPAPTRLLIGDVGEQLVSTRRAMSDRDWDALLAQQFGMGAADAA
jgi:NADP-dependent 3-hydroxy acid dehydrogenase YdfG